MTANIVALGWFATADLVKAPRFTELVPWLVGLFFFVNSLGCMALLAVGAYFQKENDRLQIGLTTALKAQSSHDAFNGSPLPLHLYKRAVHIMTLSLVAIGTVWCALGIIM